MFWIELLAAGLGVFSVYLMTAQKPLAWPIGFLMVVLYSWIFWQARLFSEMLLQLIYAALQLYGWYQWLRGGVQKQQREVSSLPLSLIRLHLIIGLIISLTLGALMSNYTSANLPWLDAALTGFSLVGQYWMAKKYLQCWSLWVVVDVIYIGMFSLAGLYLTAALYAVFTGLAVWGWLQWRTNLLVTS